MSDTPRTDTVMANVYYGKGGDDLFEHARKLERELAATQHVLHASLSREHRLHRELFRLREAEICRS